MSEQAGLMLDGDQVLAIDGKEPRAENLAELAATVGGDTYGNWPQQAGYAVRNKDRALGVVK